LTPVGSNPGNQSLPYSYTWWIYSERIFGSRED
jgi:hypothetical protein